LPRRAEAIARTAAPLVAKAGPKILARAVGESPILRRATPANMLAAAEAISQRHARSGRRSQASASSKAPSQIRTAANKTATAAAPTIGWTSMYAPAAMATEQASSEIQSDLRTPRSRVTPTMTAPTNQSSQAAAAPITRVAP